MNNHIKSFYEVKEVHFASKHMRVKVNFDNAYQDIWYSIIFPNGKRLFTSGKRMDENKVIDKVVERMQLLTNGETVEVWTETYTEEMKISEVV